MKSARFTKRPENFICERCGYEVKGNGYTNHCPQCLWSKHVDINPGDRAETCLAMMEPIGIQRRGKDLSVIQRCTGCGLIKPNRISKDDESASLLKLPVLDLKNLLAKKKRSHN